MVMLFRIAPIKLQSMYNSFMFIHKDNYVLLGEVFDVGEAEQENWMRLNSKSSMNV